MWTKEQYLQWLAERGPVGTWNHEACRNADALIRHVAMVVFTVKSREWALPPLVRDYLISDVEHHFGSVEVDEMLTHLGCYPDWIEK